MYLAYSMLVTKIDEGGTFIKHREFYSSTGCNKDWKSVFIFENIRTPWKSDDFEEKSRSVRNATMNSHPRRQEKSTNVENQIKTEASYPHHENDVTSDHLPNEVETEKLSESSNGDFGDLIFLVISLVFIGIVMILFSGLVIKHCFHNTLWFYFKCAQNLKLYAEKERNSNFRPLKSHWIDTLYSIWWVMYDIIVGYFALGNYRMDWDKTSVFEFF